MARYLPKSKIHKTVATIEDASSAEYRTRKLAIDIRGRVEGCEELQQPRRSRFASIPWAAQMLSYETSLGISVLSFLLLLAELDLFEDLPRILAVSSTLGHKDLWALGRALVGVGAVLVGVGAVLAALACAHAADELGAAACTLERAARATTARSPAACCSSRPSLAWSMRCLRESARHLRARSGTPLTPSRPSCATACPLSSDYSTSRTRTSGACCSRRSPEECAGGRPALCSRAVVRVLAPERNPSAIVCLAELDVDDVGLADRAVPEELRALEQAALALNADDNHDDEPRVNKPDPRLELVRAQVGLGLDWIARVAANRSARVHRDERVFARSRRACRRGPGQPCCAHRARRSRIVCG